MTVPTIALPSGFATDTNFSDPGKAWDGQPAKVIPSAGVIATGYMPEDERPADYDNYMFASLIEVAHKSLDYPVANWSYVATHSGFAGAFNAAAYDGAGTWCLVGASAEIQTTVNLRTFTRRTAGGGYAGELRAICFGNGLFVAVGATGGIQTSPDGVTWTQRTAAGGYVGTFEAVIWDATNSLFIVVGATGEIQTSPTGVTWTNRATGSAYAGNFTGIATSGTEIVAVGTGASNNVQRSTDGTTWTAYTRSGATRIAYHAAAGVFVAGGSGSSSAYTSPSGVTWTTRTMSGSPSFTCYGAAYDGERNLVLFGEETSPGNGSSIYSTHDGVTFTRRETPDAWSGSSQMAGKAVFGRERWLVPMQGGGALTSLIMP